MVRMQISGGAISLGYRLEEVNLFTCDIIEIKPAGRTADYN